MSFIRGNIAPLNKNTGRACVVTLDITWRSDDKVPLKMVKKRQRQNDIYHCMQKQDCCRKGPALGLDGRP